MSRCCRQYRYAINSEFNHFNHYKEREGEREREEKNSQTKLFIPARIQRVRFDGRRPDEFGGQGATQTIPVLPHPAVLPFETQFEAVMFPEFLVIRLSGRDVTAGTYTAADAAASAYAAQTADAAGVR